MSTILLACNKLSEDSARDFLSRSTPEDIKVHIKGFSARILSSMLIPSELLDFMVSCTYLIWDGDDFAADSFTNLIVEVILEKYLRSRRKMKLLAFKYKDQERTFCNNWNGRAVLNTGNETESRPDTFTINYLVRPDSKSESKYLYLGQYGINFTRATHIVTIGGGKVVGDEYKYTLQLARVEPQRHFIWHIYPIQRTISNTSTDLGGSMEKCFWDNETYGLKPEEQAPGLLNFTVILYQ